MEKNTILVAGGAGYIGSHTLVALAEAGYKAVVMDNLCNSNVKAVAAAEHIAGEAFPFVQGDVCDRQAMDRFFSTYAFDAVIHFAGLKSVGESVEQPLAYYRNNLDSTLTILECMQAHGVGTLVFSSSAAIYGDAQPPVREDAPTGACANPYGWTKYMSEQIISNCAAANPAFSAVLLRYFNPVGGHESGLLGDNPKGRPTNLMPLLVQAAHGGPAVRVFGNDYPTPDGTGVRDYIHVMDLAQAHVAALTYAFNHTGAEAINLGTGSGQSVLELIRAYEKANGVPVPFTFVPRRPGDAPACFADPEKAFRLLGWRAQRNVADMCRSAHHFHPYQ